MAGTEEIPEEVLAFLCSWNSLPELGEAGFVSWAAPLARGDPVLQCHHSQWSQALPLTQLSCQSCWELPWLGEGSGEGLGLGLH